MSRLTGTILKEYPKEFASAGFLDGMKIMVVPLQRRIIGDLRTALLVLTGAVALVLLIACANLANLLLARAAARQRELAVRMALGAGRGRIVKQVLTESLALALPGGLGGIVMAYFAVEGLNAWKPLVLESYPPILLDVPALAFTFGLTILTGIVFGMAPAAAAAGISIQDALKSANYMHSAGRRARRLRHALVVTELGVSLVLLIGAGLLARSFMELAKTELGFSTGRLLTLQVNLVGSRYATAEEQIRFFDEVLERLEQLPMMRRAAVSVDIPLSGEVSYSGSGMTFQVAGRVPVPVSQQPRAGVTVVSRDFLERWTSLCGRGVLLTHKTPASGPATLSWMKLLRGRSFREKTR